MSIIKNMYDGKIMPFGEMNIMTDDYRKAVDKLCKSETEILERFPEVKPFLEKYQDAQMKVNVISFYNEFEVGFRIGAQIMLEVFRPEE